MKLVFLRLHYLDFAIIKQNVYLKSIRKANEMVRKTRNIRKDVT